MMYLRVKSVLCVVVAVVDGRLGLEADPAEQPTTVHDHRRQLALFDGFRWSPCSGEPKKWNFFLRGGAWCRAGRLDSSLTNTTEEQVFALDDTLFRAENFSLANFTGDAGADNLLAMLGLIGDEAMMADKNNATVGVLSQNKTAVDDVPLQTIVPTPETEAVEDVGMTTEPTTTEPSLKPDVVVRSSTTGSAVSDNAESDSKYQAKATNTKGHKPKETRGEVMKKHTSETAPSKGKMQTKKVKSQDKTKAMKGIMNGDSEGVGSKSKKGRTKKYRKKHAKGKK